jgi:DNA-binding protein
MKKIKCIFTGVILVSIMLIFTACSAQTANTYNNTFTEQDINNAITELINGINSGDIDAVEKYVGQAGSVAEILVEKLQQNIKLSNIRDIKIQGTGAQATITLEVIPLKINKDITLNFNLTDVLLIDNPLGILSIFL